MTKVMKFAAILTLLALQIATPMTLHASSGQNQSDDITVTFEKLENPNPSEEPYTIAVIRPRAKAQVVTDGNRVLANSLLSIANEWFFDQLLTRYKHAPPEELKAKLIPMKAEGIHLTDKSSFIIVFKGADLRKPLGTLWSYYPDENGKIDLQTSMDSDFWKYPVPKSESRVFPFFVMKEGKVVGVKTARLPVGGVIELKRLALEPKSPRELLTAMLFRGENSDRLNAQQILDANHNSVFPAEYALRCNHALIPVYLRLGLEVVPNHPINEANEDYVMRISRINYVKRTLRMLEAARSNGWKVEIKESTRAQSDQNEDELRSKMCLNVFKG